MWFVYILFNAMIYYIYIYIHIYITILLLLRVVGLDSSSFNWYRSGTTKIQPYMGTIFLVHI
jgi:hypothetical protein